MTQTHSKRILLGITGGVAAYKSAELARMLTQAGYHVQAVMTEAASHFIGAASLQAVTGQPVLRALWDDTRGNGMAHIELSRGADAVLIAPATADFMAKLAYGLADDLLSTLCLARACPLLIAPAMNHEMWNHPATQRNVAQLKLDGVAILGPAYGVQACGETGPGRMLEPAVLCELLEASFRPKLLAGKRVLVTAGPTYEPIDPVRGLTNLSSGKMGYAVARAAWEAGAEVTLVSGPTALSPPTGVARIDVTTARQMRDAVLAQVDATDVFVGVAAVADYRVAEAALHKIKKSAAEASLTLVLNPDVLAEVAARPTPPFCVGFAAESENLLAYASEKRRAKRLPLIVANQIEQALGSDESEISLIDDSGVQTLARAPKITLARALIAHIAKRL